MRQLFVVRGNGSHTLVIETSTAEASLALVRPDGAVVEKSFLSDRQHNAALFGPLAEILHSIPPEEIGLVLVGSGPGSYSGTRVGIAAAQGVALAAGCPCAAVPSVLATQSAAGHAIAIGDARRGSWWTAEISRARLVSAPTLCDGAGLSSTRGKAACVFTFEDPSRFPDAEGIIRETPTAARLWQAWLAADDATRSLLLGDIPQPIYLKPPHITPGKRPPFAGASRP